MKEIFKRIILNVLEFKFYVKKRNGIKIYFSPDTYALALIFKNFKKNLHVRIAEQRDIKTTYVDIGANIGWYSLCAAKVGYKKIIAIEANPKTFKSLIDNISLNNYHDKIIALNLAITNKSGIALISNTTSSDQNSILKREGSHLYTLALNLDQLADILSIEEPAHLKVDIEGAEKLLIDGGQKVLSKGIFRSIEIESTFENFPYIQAILEKCGYSLKTKTDSVICTNTLFQLV